MKVLVQPRDGSAPIVAAIKKARKTIELVIFRFNCDDIERAMHAAVGRGVKVHALIAHNSKVSSRGDDLVHQRYPGHRLHVRAIVRDGRHAFVGSQSLRRLELDKRREVGLFAKSAAVVKELKATFEADWAETALGRAREEGHKSAEPGTFAAAALASA